VCWWCEWDANWVVGVAVVTRLSRVCGLEVSALSFTAWRDSAACFLSLIVILIPIDGVVDGRAMLKCVRTGVA